MTNPAPAAATSPEVSRAIELQRPTDAAQGPKRSLQPPWLQARRRLRPLSPQPGSAPHPTPPMHRAAGRTQAGSRLCSRGPLLSITPQLSRHQGPPSPMSPPSLPSASGADVGQKPPMTTGKGNAEVFPSSTHQFALCADRAGTRGCPKVGSNPAGLCSGEAHV